MLKNALVTKCMPKVPNSDWVLDPIVTRHKISVIQACSLTVMEIKTTADIKDESSILLSSPIY